MRTERDHGVTRHYYGDADWGWHMAEDGPCRLCDVQALYDAAAPIGRLVGPYVVAYGERGEAEAALDRLDEALVNLSSPRIDPETIRDRAQSAP